MIAINFNKGTARLENGKEKTIKMNKEIGSAYIRCGLKKIQLHESNCVIL